MSVKQKYLKDENGDVFSPITNKSSVYNDFNNDSSIQAITLTIANDGFLEMGSYVDKPIPFSTTLYQIGTELSRSGNEVVIGKGIRYVRVSALFGIWQSPYSQETSLVIRQKRGETNVKGLSTITSKPDTLSLLGLSIPSTILEVQQGDRIYALFNAQAAGSYKYVGRSSNSLLTVEKIG